MKRSVAILIFDEVEVLDFCGSFEVFSLGGSLLKDHPFEVFTVSATDEQVHTRGNLLVTPHYSFANCPAIDILLVPGGFGTRALLTDAKVLNWIKEQSTRAELVLSVCTGALLLGRVGLLDGLEVTTHHTCLKLLADVAPESTVLGDRRFIDTGRVITSGGISAGIDMSLHVVARLLGRDAAAAIAKEMEYQLDSNILNLV